MTTVGKNLLNLPRVLFSFAEAIEKHRKSLGDWFSQQPNEERQFGPSFSLDTTHVDPVIRETSLEEILKPSPEMTIQNQLQESCSHAIGLQNLFDVDACGRQVKNVVLYGTVGTGKSTLIKKMVMDWCHGRLPRFELIVPFSCEDLSQGNTPISLRRLITKKYVHLREIVPTLGSTNLKVLFILNGLDRLNLDFRLAHNELCCDPNEPVLPSAIVVNLLRKYMMPEVSVAGLETLARDIRSPTQTFFLTSKSDFEIVLHRVSCPAFLPGWNSREHTVGFPPEQAGWLLQLPSDHAT